MPLVVIGLPGSQSAREVQYICTRPCNWRDVYIFCTLFDICLYFSQNICIRPCNWIDMQTFFCACFDIFFIFFCRTIFLILSKVNACPKNWIDVQKKIAHIYSPIFLQYICTCSYIRIDMHMHFFPLPFCNTSVTAHAIGQTCIDIFAHIFIHFDIDAILLHWATFLGTLMPWIGRL